MARKVDRQQEHFRHQGEREHEKEPDCSPVRSVGNYALVKPMNALHGHLQPSKRAVGYQIL
jgi:hypothetical protein